MSIDITADHYYALLSFAIHTLHSSCRGTIAIGPFRQRVQCQQWINTFSTEFRNYWTPKAYAKRSLECANYLARAAGRNIVVNNTIPGIVSHTSSRLQTFRRETTPSNILILEPSEGGVLVTDVCSLLPKSVQKILEHLFSGGELTYTD